MRFHRVGAVLALSLASLGAREVGPSATCNVPQFGTAVRYPGGGTANIAVGDFNEDGHPDIAGANMMFEAQSVNVLFGTGTGSFGAPLVIPIAHVPMAIVVTDFNVDGHADIATAGDVPDAGTGVIEVFLGSGAGSFTSSITSVSALAVDLKAADFDGDGASDLAVADFSARTVSVFLGNRAGGFGPPTVITLPRGPFYLAVGDFNGDGHPDMAAATLDFTSAASSLEVSLNDGSAVFGPPMSTPLDQGVSALAAGDVNGDHRLDLVTVGGAVSVRLGDGAGGFGAPASFAVGDGPAGIVMGDFNGDGLTDLAVGTLRLPPAGGSTRPSFDVLVGDGRGSFGPLKSFRTLGLWIGNGAAADFDLDGRIDLAATDPFSEVGNVSILMNMCGNVADLAVMVSDSADPTPFGNDVTYTVQVTNDGPDWSGVALETTVPRGTDMKSFESSQGSCYWDSTIGLVQCELGNLAGAAPGNSATLRMVVSPTAPGTLTSTSTVTASVIDSNPANDSATETTLVSVLGGKDLTISAAPGGGASLSWTAGSLEAAYFVGRIAGGVTTVFPTSGVPLPAGTSGFVDPSPVPGQANCYAVAPVDAAGTAYGLSDLVCLIPNTASPAGAPTNFSLRLSQTTTAMFTWAGPGGQTAYALYAYPLNGAPSRRTIFHGSATTGADATGGISTCYALLAADGAIALGNSDALCAVPGFATLP